ncbi:MAG: NADH-quinone oxidoreductase subunit M [Nitrospirales bacterium]|nr:NADH-quinone oxidoreductase subunit M [Nitrospirales bacterium]
MHEEFTFGFPLLSLLLFLPLLGSFVIWAQHDVDLMKKSVLGIVGIELALAILLLWRFVSDSAAMQFSEHLNWIPPLGISYHLAVDGISVLFVGLTAFLMVMIVLYSWDTVQDNIKPYFMSLLALETTIIGVFVSIDLILFFVFWELMLIPSYFLIKLWGVGADRHYASLKYVLYTLLGSVFMLVGFALLSLNHHAVTGTYSFDLLDLLKVSVPVDQQIVIFWMIFLGLAFKAPIFPFHSWLPDALVQGPIGMSVVLAGIKLATYGFLRFSFPLLPEASTNQTVVVLVMALGLIAIVYGAVIAIIQTDFRRLLVFSSISHLGFVVIGLFALNFQGLQGSLLQMINLGFTTAGLFFLAGVLYERLGNTLIESGGGLAKRMPMLAIFMLIIGMASIGLPGTNGFIGEFLVLLGTFQAHWLYGLIAVSGVILAASYFLWYYERAIFGPLGSKVPAVLKDLTQRETLIAVSISVMIFWIGLYPSPFLRMINGSIQAVVLRLDQGLIANQIRANTVVAGVPIHSVEEETVGHMTISSHGKDES